MANYATLIAAIQSVITQNGNNEITGPILQQTLISVVNSLGSGYQFIGIATPETTPGTPDQKVFYIGSAGTYPNFGPAVIPDGNLAVFYYDSSWHFGSVAFPIGNGAVTTNKIADDAVTADKLAPDVKEQIIHPVAVEDSANDADLDISDENRAILARFKDGHFRVKYFDSAKNNANLGIDSVEEFSTTENYEIGQIVKRNGLLYKFIETHDAGAWDSAQVEQTNVMEAATHPVAVEDSGNNADLDISDGDGNILARFKDGHFKTKYFDSQNIDFINIESYWKTYIDDKLSELNTADLSLGRNGVSFIFATDVHWGNNYKKSPSIIEYINSITAKKDFICGGDIIVGHGTRNEKIQELKDWVAITQKCNLLTNLIGNHDYNTSDQPSASWDTNRITPGEHYRICLAGTEKKVTYLDNPVANKYNEYYGFVDNQSQKMRYIFLDSGAVHIPNWADTNLRLSDNQVNWMKEKIIELESGWSVVVFTHIFFQSYSGTVHGIGNQIETALNEIYDTCAATIVGVICGHVHASINKISTKGYPIISTTCDARMESNHDGIPAVSGTTTEQAFDIFYINTELRTINIIRIGAGSNRNFNY